MGSISLLKGAQVWDLDLLDSNDFYIMESLLEGWNKNFKFLQMVYTLHTGHFVFATACAVYACNLLPYANCTLANCYRMRSER